MDPVIPPPPQPPQPQPQSRNGGSRVWIIVLAVLVIAGLLFAGVAVVGFYAFQRVKQKQAAVAELKKVASEERERMAEAVMKGDTQAGDVALSRMKEQLEKTASQSGGADAGAVRAIASFLGKMQEKSRQYSAVLAKVQEEKVFEFDIPDRATLEKNRGLVREFLAANDQLIDLIKRSEELVRAELDAAKVPPRTRDAALLGYTQKQILVRPLQLKIRKCDQVLGESCLAAMDLLDKNWGKWKHDEASGTVLFEDDSVIEAFNEQVEKIQAAAAEQETAQKELFNKQKALSR